MVRVYEYHLLQRYGDRIRPVLRCYNRQIQDKVLMRSKPNGLPTETARVTVVHRANFQQSNQITTAEIGNTATFVTPTCMETPHTTRVTTTIHRQPRRTTRNTAPPLCCFSQPRDTLTHSVAFRYLEARREVQVEVMEEVCWPAKRSAMSNPTIWSSVLTVLSLYFMSTKTCTSIYIRRARVFFAFRQHERSRQMLL